MHNPLSPIRSRSVRRPRAAERADPGRVPRGRREPRRVRCLRQRPRRRLVRAGVRVVLRDRRRGRRRERPRRARLALLAGRQPGGRGDRSGADVRRHAGGGHAGGRDSRPGRHRAARLQPRSGRPRKPLTSRTRFLLPVHLYGQMADMQSLRSLADRAGLAIVEDACQAHGAERDGLRAGPAACGAFSFYPAKNLGAMGDAGALTTDDENLAEAVRALREHGQSRKYHHDLEGYTARLDTIQAIVLELKAAPARRLERGAARGGTRSRRSARGRRRPRPPGRRRRERPGLASLRRPDGRPRVAGRLSARARDRDRPPLSGARAPRSGLRAPRLRGREVSDRGAGRARRISLPIFPGITESQLTAVADAVRAYFSRGD